jgi:L-fuculose-phosphate aldolase
MSAETALREQVCLIGRLMHGKGFIDGSAGNISARLDGERVLATPSGIAKGFMTPDQLIVVNLAGERVDTPVAANANLRPTSELLMHLECYRQRPDVAGVVHAHPAYCIALTLVGYDFGRAIIPEAVVLLGAVPVTPYATPASAENRDAIRGLIGQHDAILLAHHGSLTAAKTVWDAYLLLETLEHTAHILHLAAQLGEARTLPAHQVAKLLAVRESLGLAR